MSRRARGHEARQAGGDQLAFVAIGSRDLDSAFGDGDRGAVGVRVHREHRSLDRRREQPGLDPEMRQRLLLDLVEGAAIGLDHFDEALRRRLARHREARRRRQDDDVAAMDQHRAARRPGAERVTRRQRHAARGRGGSPVMLEGHGPAGLADPPRRFGSARLGAERRGEDQEWESAAHLILRTARAAARSA